MVIQFINNNKKEKKMKTKKALNKAGSFIRKHNVAVICVGGAIIAAPIALAAAPVIAASLGAVGILGTTATTGTVISGLSGVVLTNASLAAIGNGALIVGGGGMAGGIAVIGTAGAAAGAGVGAATKSIYNTVRRNSDKSAL